MGMPREFFSALELRRMVASRRQTEGYELEASQEMVDIASIQQYGCNHDPVANRHSGCALARLA